MFRFGSWFLFSCHILKLFSSFSRSTLNSEIMLSWLPFARIINDKAILSFALATIFCNFSWLSAVKKITNTRIWHFSDFSNGRCAITFYPNTTYKYIRIFMSIFLSGAWVQLSYAEKWHTAYFNTTSVQNPGFFNNVIVPFIKLTVVEDK